MLRTARNWAAKIVANKERLGILGLGLIGNQLITWGFDLLLYPFVIWKMGVWRGGAVMTVASFVVCYLIILFYDWSKKDWIGIETIKTVKDYEGESKVGRFVSWVMKRGEGFIFFFLSIRFDPLITTLYMRQGVNEFNGLSARDWKIFLTSLVIGNVYWTLVSYMGVTVLEYVWHTFVL